MKVSKKDAESHKRLKKEFSAIAMEIHHFHGIKNDKEVTLKNMFPIQKIIFKISNLLSKKYYFYFGKSHSAETAKTNHLCSQNAFVSAENRRREFRFGKKVRKKLHSSEKILTGNPFVSFCKHTTFANMKFFWFCVRLPAS